MAINSPHRSLALMALLAACSPQAAGDGVADRPRAATHSVTTPTVRDPDLNPFLGMADLNAWRRERAEQCVTIGETPSNEDETELAAIRDVIGQSELGRITLREMRGTRISLCNEASGVFEGHDVSKTAGIFRSKYRALGLADRLTEGRKILTGAHEYRHAWQSHNVPVAFGKGLGQVAHATRNFIIEADARTFAVAVAWQLKEQGDTRAWDAAMALDKSYKPMAEAFQARMDQITADEGQTAINADSALTRAMSDAYNMWFTEPGNRQSYVNSMNKMFVEKLDTWGATATLPHSFAVQIGRVPGTGASYLGLGATAQAQIEAIRSVQFPEGVEIPATPVAARP